MIKIPLVSNLLLDESKDIEFKLSELVFDRKVFNFRERFYENKDRLTGQYSQIIKLPSSNKLQLYYQAHPHDEEKTHRQGSICYAESCDDGKTFVRCNQDIYHLKSKEPNNIIFMEGLTCNNFQVFVHKKYYCAIGGYSVNNTYHRNCRCNKQTYPEKNINDPVWPTSSKNKISWEINHPCHGNGIYLFKSKDGIHWNQESKTPIIHHGLGLKYNKPGTLGFDGCPRILFDEKTQHFFLYIRGNIKLGVRHILFSKSQDLYNWSDLEEIKLPNFDYNYDNYYFPSIYKYPDTDYYIGFISYFKNKILNKSGSKRKYWNSTNKIIFSKDGIIWDNPLELNIKSVIKLSKEWEGHMTFPHIISFIKSNTNSNFYLYAHHGFLTNNNVLIRYKIEQDRFKYLENINNKIGIITIKYNIPLNNQSLKHIYINHKTANNGYLLLELLDNNKNIIDRYSAKKCSKIIGDSIKHKVKWVETQLDLENKSHIYIKIYIFNSKVYSLYLE